MYMRYNPEDAPGYRERDDGDGKQGIEFDVGMERCPPESMGNGVDATMRNWALGSSRFGFGRMGGMQS